MALDDIVKDAAQRSGLLPPLPGQDQFSFKNVADTGSSWVQKLLSGVSASLTQPKRTLGERMGMPSIGTPTAQAAEPMPLAQSHAPELIPSHEVGARSTVLSDAKKTIDTAKEKLPAPQQATAPPDAAQPPGPSQEEKDMAKMRTGLMDYLQGIKENQQKIMDYYPRMDDAQKALASKYIEELQEIKKQVTETAFKPVEAPEFKDSEEVRETKKYMQILAPIVTGLMAVASILKGGSTFSPAGVNFANAYNSMVDTWRERDFEDFAKSTRDFENQLQRVKATNTSRLDEYKIGIEKAIRGLDITSETFKLKMQEIQLPLDRLLQESKIIESGMNAITPIMQMFETTGLKKAMMAQSAAIAEQKNQISLLRTFLEGRRTDAAERRAKAAEATVGQRAPLIAAQTEKEKAQAELAKTKAEKEKAIKEQTDKLMGKGGAASISTPASRKYKIGQRVPGVNGQMATYGGVDQDGKDIWNK